MTAWYRVVELEDGQWACKRGLQIFDVHDGMTAAIEHSTHIAGQDPPSQVIVHRRDSAVQTVATFP